MSLPAVHRIKAALAGVLFAWLCLMQGAYGLANLGPEIRDPANFLPPRILVGAESTTTIKPSRPQTLDRQAIASALPEWLSREPLGEKESLNLYQFTGGDPINYVDVNGLAKVALDGKGNLTELGQVILDVAKGDPNAARSLLMASQVSAEMSGANVAGLVGDGGEDAISNVTRAIETAVGNAQGDGRDEWKLIAPQAGADSYFGGYKDAWMKTKMAEYAPLLAANAGRMAQASAERRQLAERDNSAVYRFGDLFAGLVGLPGKAGAFAFNTVTMADITSAPLEYDLMSGGYHLGEERSGGERLAMAGLMIVPELRGGMLVDDVARVGMRAERSFAGTALKPWGASPLALTYDASVVSYQAGKIRSFITETDEIYYRLYSGNSTTGSFLSKMKPKGADWATEAFALPPGNRADFLQEVLVPAGTRLQRSRAAPNLWGRGGAEQFELLKLYPNQYQPVLFGTGIPFR